MADLKDDDALELTEEMKADEADIDEHNEDSQAEAGDDADEDEEIVTFEDGESPAPGDADTGLVKHLRTQLSEQRKELDRLRKAPPVAAPIVVGEKPTLAGMDYDESAFETALDQWKERQAKADAQVRDAQTAQQQQTEAWNSELKAHADKRAALKFKDAQEAEDVVIATLSDVQQAVIVKAAENSAMVVYALGKHPGKLAELSKITDPLKLAAAVARLEGKLTVAKRGGPPEPERIARGSASLETGSDQKKLAKLEDEAARTGDRTKVVAFKREMSSRAK